MHPTTPSQFGDVLGGECLRTIKELHAIGGTPGRIIHLFETQTDQKQTSVFGEVNPGNNPPSAQTTPRKADSNDLHALWQIASASKPFIVVVFARLVNDSIPPPFKISWEMRVNDIMDECEKNGSRKMKRLYNNPRLVDLLAHVDAVAEMNECFVAMDGRCIQTDEEFLDKFSDITRHKSPHLRNREQQYGSGSYILAGILLEAIFGRDLDAIMEKYVFRPLEMHHTFMGRDPTTAEKKQLVPGYFLDSTHERRRVPERLYEGTVGRIVLGAYSCIADLAKFYQLLFSAVSHKKFEYNFLTSELARAIVRTSTLEPRFSLLGAKLELNTSVTVPQSLNQHLLPSRDRNELRPYTNGSGKAVRVIRISGYVDGYSITVYCAWDLSGVVIILGNSSGPLDVSDHIVHYLLQEFCGLTPQVSITNIARSQHHTASARLGQLESQHRSGQGGDQELEEFAGHYVYELSGERITIHVDGYATIGQSQQSGRFCLARPRLDQLRIVETAESPFGIETWSVWKDMSLEIRHNANRRISLIHRIGAKEREFERKVPNPA